MGFQRSKENSFFANFKKCQFHKNKVYFLDYIVSIQGVQIEDESMDIMKNWLELKSVYDIQVFLGFPNFYQYFIQGFSKIAWPLTLMLRIISLIGLLIIV